MGSSESVSWTSLVNKISEGRKTQMTNPKEKAMIVKEIRESNNDACEAVNPPDFALYPEDDQDKVGHLMDKADELSDEENKEGLSSLVSKDFSDQIEIDFIPSIDYRILCRFLGVTSVNSIKNQPFHSHPLITLILMENINKFMDHIGYEFAGELNFDAQGNSIPPEKNPWCVKGEETTFTVTGFLYFQKKGGKKNENASFFLYTDTERGVASIHCYTTSITKSKKLIVDLQTYSKKYNCLRGSKLRDVNMISASFIEVDIQKKYNWDNYYYPDNIKELFDLEVFGFVKNIKKYNSCGITKRGIILYGSPGTGKTTIGNIICNMVPDHTVIWITPEILAENNYRAISSIKALYKLAEFLSPCIIILEDLDLFSQDRDRGGDVLGLGALMNILDGVNTVENAVTIGTTNRLNAIEKALRNRPGRFDRVIEIPALSEKLRKRMFTDRFKEWKVEKGVLDYVVENTDGWTGAEIQEFINSLSLKQISSKRKTKKIDLKWAEEIIGTMQEFGIGEISSAFGFSKKAE
jgi:hypothetical protein